MRAFKEDESQSFQQIVVDRHDQSVYQQFDQISQDQPMADSGSIGSFGKIGLSGNKNAAICNSIQDIPLIPQRKLSDLNQNDYIIVVKDNRIQEIVSFLKNQILLTEDPFFVTFHYERAYQDQAYQLYITNYRLLLQYEGSLHEEIKISTEDSKNLQKKTTKTQKKYRSIPLGYLEALNSSQNFLLLKNGMKLFITGLGNQFHLCKKISESVNQIPFFMVQESNYEGKQVYDSLAEVERMGIRWKMYSCVQNKNRRGQKVCPTYPRFFTIPKKIQKNYLSQALSVWDKKRVPVLAYHHFNNQACIWRSAKLMLGKVESQESIVKLYLNAISPTYVRFDLFQRDKNRLYTQKKGLANSRRKSSGLQEQFFESSKVIKDTLQQLIFSYLKMNEQEKNLLGSTITQKKSEKEKEMTTNKFQQNFNFRLQTIKTAYQQIIPNMRSGRKVENQNFIKVLSTWYEDIDAIITCAYKIAFFVMKGEHVIIQESQNANRASQIIALAQVLLDPFYRTFHGFSVLIQKEFISHGTLANSDRIALKAAKPVAQLDLTKNNSRNSIDSSSSSGLQVFSYEKSNGNDGNSNKNAYYLNKTQDYSSRIKSNTVSNNSQRNSSESNSILIEFLQCLNQLINAYPDKFEYSGSYLARVGYQIYSRKFSNFQQIFRVDYKKSEQRVCRNSYYRSIWQHIDKKKSYYNYQWKTQKTSGNGNGNQGKELASIRNKPSLKQYTIWKQYYDLVGYFQAQELRDEFIDNRGNLYSLLKMNQEKKKAQVKIATKVEEKQEYYQQMKQT